MIIREVTLDDAAQMLAIYAPHVETSAVSFELELPSIEEFQQRIQSYTAKYPWYVACVENQIVGYAYASAYRERKAYQYCVETSVYIAENAQQRGIARALYTTLFDALKQRGFTQAFAVITQPNEKSVAFHQSQGFESFALFEKVGYKFEQWHDVLWMRKYIQKDERLSDSRT